MNHSSAFIAHSSSGLCPLPVQENRGLQIKALVQIARKTN